MFTKTLIGFFLCLLGTTVLATTRSPRLGGPEFCNLQQINSAQPSTRLEFEGGLIEEWDRTDDQFQCLGVAPVKKTVYPQSLSLPSYRPFPRLAFVEQGEGIIGIQFAGCAETFDTGVTGVQQQQQQSRRMGGQGYDETSDSHQRVHRFRRGDIIAIPAGAVYWTYNDGNEDLVAIIVDDLNNPGNQLDLTHRLVRSEFHYYTLHYGSKRTWFGRTGCALCRSVHGSKRSIRGQDRRDSENVFAGFDTELLAEAFNADPQIVRAMQESASNRGLIVKVQQPMQFVTPDDEQQQWRQEVSPFNGIEEQRCSSQIFYNLDSQREADVFSRQAGKLNYVNEHKLPILSFLDLSASKGRLHPNALISPYWSINSHTIIYVLNGDAQVQVVSNNGEAVLNEQVNKGDIYVVPQFFVTTTRAGQNGFEWVAFKTNKSPVKSMVAGYTSVFRSMPLEVITSSFDVSPSQAQQLKMNRETESILLSPQRTN